MRIAEVWAARINTRSGTECYYPYKFLTSCSVMHYIDDCGDAPPNKVAYANIRIARRSPVHYNLYIDTPSAKQAYNEICIEAGRQNAFLTIVLFLQSMVQMADKMRGSLAPIKDLVEDVLGVDAVY